MKKSACLGMECGYCRTRCPAFSSIPLESSTARGKARILEAYRKGTLSAKDILEASYVCARCGYCDEVCPVGAGAREFLLEMRRTVVEGRDVPDELKDMLENLERTGTPYGKRVTDWSRLASGDGKRARRPLLSKGRTAYFPGCTLQAKTPEIAAGTMRLLEMCGVDAIPIPDLCCGSPYINAGLTGKWEENARKVMDYFRENRITKIIVHCPGCARAFLEDYRELDDKKLMKKFPEIIILSKVLLKNLQKLPMKRMSGRAIYHDPCHLGRSLGITEEPRQLIRAAGPELVEFRAHGKLSECCGGGGLLQVFRKEESRKALDKRTMEAVVEKVDYLVSACGHCESRFRDFVGAHPDCGFEVLDVVDLFDIEMNHESPGGETSHGGSNDGG